MSITGNIYQSITGLNSVNADNVVTHNLSSIEQDTKLLKCNIFDNYENNSIQLKTALIPDVTASYNLGSSDLRYNDIFSTTIDVTTLSVIDFNVDGTTNLDQTTINTTDGNFKVWNGTNTYILTDNSGNTDINNIRFSASNIGLSTDTNLLALADNELTVNGNFNLSTGSEFQINNAKILDSLSLGASVTSSSLTSVGILTSLSVTGNISCSGITISSDITQFNDTINSNRYYRAGTNLNNHYQIQYITNSLDTNLDYVLFRTISSDSNANKAKLLIEINDADIAEFLDDSFNLKSGMVYKINNTEVLSNNTLSSAVLSSSLTSVGVLSSGSWQAAAIADAYISSASTWNGKQDSLTFGIANGNSVVIDSGTVNSGEYPRYTSGGLESRTIAEIKSDLTLSASDVGLGNVENTTLSTWTGSSNITNLGNINSGSITSFGNVNIGSSTLTTGVLAVTGSATITQNTNGGHLYVHRNTNSGSSAYSGIFLQNDGAAVCALFMNSSTRSSDGGTNNTTIRNDAGEINLQSAGGGGLNISGGVVTTSSNIDVGGIITTQGILPDADSSRNIGSTSKLFNAAYLDNLYVGNSSYVGKISNPSGTILIETHTTGQAIYLKPDGSASNAGYIACSTTNTTINNHVIPGADSSYDLGTTSLRWHDGYITSLDVENNIIVRNGLTTDIASVYMGPAPSSGAEGPNFDYCSLIRSTSAVASHYGSQLSFYTHPTNYQNDPSIALNIDFNQLATFYGTITASTDNTYDLGSSSLGWKDIYVHQLIARDGIDVYIKNHFIPSSNGNKNLGWTSNRWNDVHTNGINMDGGGLCCLDSAATTTPLILRSNSDTAGFDFIINAAGTCRFQDSGTGSAWQVTPGAVMEVGGGFLPISDNNISCGNGSWRFTDIYAVSGSVNTSDRRLKKDIVDLPDSLGLDFINKLRPVNYKWNEGKRTHQGFISQEIADTLKDSGMDPNDIAIYVDGSFDEVKENIRIKKDFDKKQLLCKKIHDEKNTGIEYVIEEYVPKETNPYKLGLRYAHFIAPLVKSVQELSKMVEAQNHQISKLKKTIRSSSKSKSPRKSPRKSPPKTKKDEIVVVKKKSKTKLK